MNYLKKQILIAIAAAVGVALSSVGLFAYADQNPFPDPAPAADRTTAVQASYAQTENVRLSMKASSVEHDLYIYIMNEEGNNVEGVGFEVLAEGPGGERLTFKDAEKTGKIYADELEPGEYTLALKETGDFVFPKPLKVEVNDKVKTEVIENIGKEIVSASKVNAATEDPNYPGNAVIPDMPVTPAAPVPADTVEFVESEVVKTEAKESVPLLDKNGNQVLKYRPVLSGGRLLLWDGSKSEYSPATDGEGYCLPDDKEIFGADGKPLQIEVAINYGEPEEEAPPSETPDPQTETPDPQAAETTEANTVGAAAETNPQETMMVAKYQLEAVLQFTEKKASEVSYRGWQNLDGKRYYYTKNGVRVTGEQVIQGVRYTFDSNGALQQNAAGSVSGRVMGIDISTYQKPIDWATAKANGVHFAMIRAGYRGYTVGGLIEDDRFASHAQGAQAAGVKVGIYFFSQAVNTKEAVQEASAAIEIARKHGIRVNYPIAIDIEYSNGSRNGRADGLSGAERTAVAKAFCDTVRSAGYVPMIYASSSWFSSGSFLSMSGAGHWVAQWPTTAGGSQRALDCRPEERSDRGWGMWQFTSKASIPGVPGVVDTNYSYIGY